jgi:8-oxo-dGTP pyrophosphatase MutT (NUDIX family)
MNFRFIFFDPFELNFVWVRWGVGGCCVGFQDRLTFSPSLQCLLVKGWKAGASWSFPRGKRNKDEEDHTCAVREVSF